MLKPLFPFSSAILTSAVVFALSPALLPAPGARPPQEPAATPAPPPAPAVKNPVKPTPESQAKAKKTYGYDCALCHGATGNGKTDLAKDMSLALSDWTDPKVLAARTDGELFQVIRNGKDKMPGEPADRAKDDEVWNLVIYVRHMAKAPASVSIR